MKIPASLRAGDSVSWLDDPSKDNLGNVIDSDTWALSYAIRGATVLDLTATPSGKGWASVITTTQSSALTAGIYYWSAFATNGSDRVTLGSGQIEILPNLVSQTSGYDGRTQTQKDLEAVEGAIRTLIAGGAVAEYTIAGRSVRKTPMADLILLRDKLKARAVREQKAAQIANGLGNPSNVLTRFK